jgi:hypothetical protein
MSKTAMEKAPDWHSERFYEQSVKPAIEKDGYFILNWKISKETMIATLNYIRTKHKLTCQWIENGHQDYLIKIFTPTNKPNE